MRLPVTKDSSLPWQRAARSRVHGRLQAVPVPGHLPADDPPPRGGDRGLARARAGAISGLFRPADLLLRHRRPGMPPGQHEISTFPRYGTQLHGRDPRLPPRPVVEIGGDPVTLAALRALPRIHLVADFHCVAGWTARTLAWDGVRLRDACPIPPGTTHVRAVGRDGYRAVLLLEDALADDVLIADTLDGVPIPPEHGGPVRLLSASQYGYKSVKHLCRLEFHDREPSDAHLRPSIGALLRATGPHLRARVWLEERHRHLPAWALRPIARGVIHPMTYALSYLGHRRSIG